MNQRAVYPGTFDPITNGHLDIIRRAARLFPDLIIAVAESAPKRPLLSLNDRVAAIQASIVDLPEISVISFQGLLIHFLQEHQASYLIRGIRAVSDFEYEFQLAGMNKQLSPTVETIFLPSSTEYTFLSSSLVREIALLGGDITPFVPPPVLKMPFLP